MVTDERRLSHHNNYYFVVGKRKSIQHSKEQTFKVIVKISNLLSTDVTDERRLSRNNF